jgi:hypothetical protein
MLFNVRHGFGERYHPQQSAAFQNNNPADI